MTAVINDTMTVVNGPEDGTQFHIVRSPAFVGFHESCAINVRLDNSVHRRQAQLTPVSHGYRVRSTSNSPVYVNGKRASGIRSRIMRTGDTLTVGHTDLILECPACGLASRSRGIVTENDLVWAVRSGLYEVYRAIAAVLRFIGRIPLWFARNWKITLVVLVVAAFIAYPVFREYVFYYAVQAKDFVNSLVDRLSSS